MYWEYFGFEENPFSIAPDPRFLFMSKRHQEALAHLVYGISEGGGFVLLTGEVGTGKTTLCRSLIEQLPEDVELAFVLNPRVNEVELLATICDEMGVAYPRDHPSLKLLVDRLNEHLLAANARGRQPVLLVDEAQNLSPTVLEQVRLLTNLETTTRKLLKIVLIGQPELRDVLKRAGLRQLDQRITARYHLEALTAEETAGYIRHRLEVAGAVREIFTPRAIREVHRRSGGVPRLINTLCDRALLGAYGVNKDVVDLPLVRGAAAEVIGHGARMRSGRWWLAAGLSGAAVAGVVIAAGPVHLALTGLIEPVPAPLRGALDAALDTAAGGTATVDVAPGPALVAEAGRDGLRAPAAALTRPSHDGIATPLPPPAPVAGLPALAALGPAPPRRRAPLPPTSEPPAVVVAAAMLPRPGPSEPPEAARHDGEPTDLAALAPPPASSFEAQLSAAPAGDIESAMAAVFDAWGYDYDALDGVSPCKKARYAQLQCHQGKADWHDLRVANRPAVITLRTADGRRMHVALVSLDEETAVVVAGGERLETPVAALSALWTGNYLLLWRPPFNYQRQLKLGVVGRDVAWVKDRLAELRGETPQGASDAVFDDTLGERVRAFQRVRNIKVDGIVGPHTLIQLNQAMPGFEAPALRR